MSLLSSGRASYQSPAGPDNKTANKFNFLALSVISRYLMYRSNAFMNASASSFGLPEKVGGFTADVASAMRTALSGNGSDDDAVDAAVTGSGSNVGEIGGEVDDGSSDGCCFSVSDDDVGCLRVELRVMTVPLLEDCFCIQPDLSTRCQECQEGCCHGCGVRPGWWFVSQEVVLGLCERLSGGTILKHIEMMQSNGLLSVSSVTQTKSKHIARVKASLHAMESRSTVFYGRS